MANMQTFQIFGVDHGYGNVKTVHTIFPANVERCASEPALAENKLFWAGHWYAVGDGHKEFLDDKTRDEDYRIMTMAAVAMELKLMGLTQARVFLAVGLPLTWCGEQKDRFRDYLTKYKTLEFIFNGMNYKIEIVGAKVYPQGLAAFADRIDGFAGFNMFCDIGCGTLSIFYINNGVPVSNKCFTEKYGTYQCTLAVREAVMREMHTTIDDRIIEQVLRTGTADISERALKIICNAAKDYVKGIVRCLNEHEYNPELMRLYLMGGGACLVKNFGEINRNRVTIIDDIHASAKGYEWIARMELTGGDAP